MLAFWACGRHEMNGERVNPGTVCKKILYDREIAARMTQFPSRSYTNTELQNHKLVLSYTSYFRDTETTFLSISPNITHL